MSKEILERGLSGTRLKAALRRRVLFDRLSGSSFTNKIKRLLLTPDIYIPHLIITKLNIPINHLWRARLFWGKKVTIPLTDWDALLLRTFGYPGGTDQELKLSRFFIKNFKPEDIFYDIGANYGFYTYLASEICKEVHAFEPIPHLAHVVQKNTRGDKRVRVNAVALSNTSGTTNLHLTGSSGLSTIRPIESHTQSETFNFKKTIRVSTSTLDDYVSVHMKPTMLKIDVEGAEALVIQGGEKFFTENSPIVAMEVWPAAYGEELSAKAVEQLRNLGYSSYAIDDAGELHKVDGDLGRFGVMDNFVFKKS